MKTCTACNLKKDNNDFPRTNSTKDGRHTNCKKCVSEKRKAAYPSYKVKIEEYQQKHDYTQYKHEWHLKNKDKRAEYNRRYFATDEAKLGRIIREHNRNNKKKGTFTKAEWLTLCEKYGHKCLRCKQKFDKLSPDHIIPLSKGGLNIIANIQPLCLQCNKEKYTDSTDYRISS